MHLELDVEAALVAGIQQKVIGHALVPVRMSNVEATDKTFQLVRRLDSHRIVVREYFRIVRIETHAPARERTYRFPETQRQLTRSMCDNACRIAYCPCAVPIRQSNGIEQIRDIPFAKDGSVTWIQLAQADTIGRIIDETALL